MANPLNAEVTVQEVKSAAKGYVGVVPGLPKAFICSNFLEDNLREMGVSEEVITELLTNEKAFRKLLKKMKFYPYKNNGAESSTSVDSTKVLLGLLKD